MNGKVVTAVVVVLILIGIGFLLYTRQNQVTVSNTETSAPTPAADLLLPEPTASGAAMVKKDLVLDLDEQNDSSQSGTAKLSEVNGKTVVTLTLKNPVKTAEPAHIHVGACPAPGAIKYPLTSVVNGSSVTTLDVDMKTLLSQLPLAINVHKSAADIKTYVSCGDIKAQ